jgi:hypothetical protein
MAEVPAQSGLLLQVYANRVRQGRAFTLTKTTAKAIGSSVTSGKAILRLCVNLLHWVLQMHTGPFTRPRC